MCREWDLRGTIRTLDDWPFSGLQTARAVSLPRVKHAKPATSWTRKPPHYHFYVNANWAQNLLRIYSNWSSWPSPLTGPIWLCLCQPSFPSPWLSNQNTTITSLSNLVAHLVKLIPGGREERLFGLLAEWHKAWKWLVLVFLFTWCILGFSLFGCFGLYMYYTFKFHIYSDVLGLIY